MSQENIEIVRRGFEAGNRGDLDGGSQTSRRIASTSLATFTLEPPASIEGLRHTSGSSVGC